MNNKRCADCNKSLTPEKILITTADDKTICVKCADKMHAEKSYLEAHKNQEAK